MVSLGKLFTGRSHTFSGRRRFQYCTVIRRTGSVLLVFAWLLLVVTACGAPLASRALIPVPAAPPMPTSTGYALGSPFSALEGTLENTYAAVNPSVVNISVVQKEEVSYPQSPDFPFFGPSLPQGPQEQYRNGLGSGFVLDKEGHIVTNNHVVAGADTITVTFYCEC